MKLLFVVQGYGQKVSGGAETHCRMMATRMAQRGHDVHVATCCASTYETWENDYEPGESTDEGVTLHRFAVDVPRDVERFGLLSARVLTGYKPVPLLLQEEWIEEQGPHIPEFLQWLQATADTFDAIIFFTYLYYPTVRGLPLVADRVPTVLHPLSHDEAPYYLPIFDRIFTLPTALAYSVEEDQALAERRAHPATAGDVAQEIVGIGTELDQIGDGHAFRSSFGLDDPYLVCVGRVDSHKGSHDLYGYFRAYKERNPGNLKLVFIGEAHADLTATDDVLFTGQLSVDDRNNAVAGALASVHPSYFESFSMSLVEAWAQRIPALVNARCEVLNGQALRSGGGLPYDGFAEFEAAVDLLLADETIRKRLGEDGRNYVQTRYDWDVVMNTYEAFLQKVIRLGK